MQNITIIIDGVNINNDHLLNDIAGIAGYVGLVKVVDECTRKITLGTSLERAKAGISDTEINSMLAAYVMSGFKISSVLHD